MEASNQDQGLLNDLRKQAMVNILNVILTFIIVELMEWSPIIFRFCLRQIQFESATV